MKRSNLILILLSITVCGCFDEASKKQITKSHLIQYKPLKTFNKDTLKYITENFIVHKGDYKHGQLKTIFESLELPIKTFAVGNGGYDQMQCTSVSLYFFTEIEADKKVKNGSNPVILVTTIEKPFPLNDITTLIRKNHGDWTKEEESLLGEKLVGDIQLVDFSGRKYFYK